MPEQSRIIVLGKDFPKDQLFDNVKEIFLERGVPCVLDHDPETPDTIEEFTYTAVWGEETFYDATFEGWYTSDPEKGKRIQLYQVTGQRTYTCAGLVNITSINLLYPQSGIIATVMRVQRGLLETILCEKNPLYEGEFSGLEPEIGVIPEMRPWLDRIVDCYIRS